jgi:hypothetical protein
VQVIPNLIAMIERVLTQGSCTALGASVVVKAIKPCSNKPSTVAKQIGKYATIGLQKDNRFGRVQLTKSINYEIGEASVP